MAQLDALRRRKAVVGPPEVHQDHVGRSVTDLAQELITVRYATNGLEPVNRVKDKAETLSDDRMVVG
jgi:hypothetical protein